MISKIACGLIGISALNLAVAAQSHTIDKMTGIESWENSVAGVSISLTQILPDQIRAFYVNRGFDSEVIEPYAKSCVYMTILRNDTATGVAHFRVADWTVDTGSGTQHLTPTRSWVDQLRMAGSSNAAMIAFRWAQFPSEHAYEPGGDWNQGMLSIGLDPGMEFDLNVRWKTGGKGYEGKLTDVRCARESL